MCSQWTEFLIKSETTDGIEVTLDSIKQDNESKRDLIYEAKRRLFESGSLPQKFHERQEEPENYLQR